MDSPEPKIENMMVYLQGEQRYATLATNFPERANRLYEKIINEAKDRYEHCRMLVDLSYGNCPESFSEGTIWHDKNIAP